MNLRIEVLPAFYGDSILISFSDADNNVRNILIDGGISKCYPTQLKSRVQAIKNSNQNIDLLIVTHIDSDHIGGISQLFQDKELDKKFIKKIWFNSERNISKKYPSLIHDPKDIILTDIINTQTSTKQALTLEKELIELNCWDDDVVEVNEKFKEYNLYGIKLTVISPNFEGIVALNKKMTREMNRDTYTSSKKNDYDKSINELINNDFKEDTSVTNKSSIAFLLEDKKGNKYLFLGDSHPTDIIIALKKLGFCEKNKIKLEYVKLSHHASKGNINEDLLKIINCNKFIVSTNGQRDNLPNKETFARILQNNKDSEFYFNYDNVYHAIFSDEEIKKIKVYYKTVLEG